MKLLIFLVLSRYGLVCKYHETIIRTGKTCNKISCCMRDPVCRWLIVKIANTFRSYVKNFLIFPRERNCRILIALYK